MANAKYRSIIALVCLIAASACTSSPVAPTTTAAPPAVQRELDFDINIPDVATAQSLKRQYPNGVHLSPVAAQDRWSYTAAYGGTPNVYFGEVAPRCQYVLGVGIVVAPLRVASMDTFTAADWNIAEPGFVYAWVGRFVYTAVARPGSFSVDPTATCS